VKKTKLAVVSFNVSRRYLSTSISFVDKAINRVFRELSLIVVHSRAERQMFVRKHELKSERVVVALFGFDVPDDQRRTSGASTPFGGTPYVCMVGRNNRDFVTLKQALFGTKIPAVFVGSRSSNLALSRTDLIEVMYDLPFDKCLEVIRNAALNILLLKDGQRGAGHMTAVNAMMLGKPHVFSNVEIIGDYLISGLHGVSVPLGTPELTRQAILLLYHNDDIARTYGKEAKRYALKYLSNSAFQQRIHSLLEALLESRPLDTFDPIWKAYIDGIDKNRRIQGKATSI
jgi:hypothetical protein